MNPSQPAPATLDALFRNTRRGKAFFAESVTSGKIVHISEVPSGLACGCVCPGCGKRMVARKGLDLAHHFGHEAADHERSCTSAGETALHKFAKQYLQENRRFLLTELVVHDGEFRQLVVPRQELSFDKATLEQHEGSVVPDVVLTLKGRPLIVEFKVTHPCGPEKIARLQEKGWSAIEVDLSSYRGRELATLGKAIVFDAPRNWLHHRLEATARKTVADRRAAKGAGHLANIERLRTAYRHRRPSLQPGQGEHELAARRDGLDGAIALDVDGTGCFSMPPAEWQALILRTLIDSPKVLATTDLLGVLRANDMLNPTFADVTEAMAAEIAVPGLRFASPFGAVFGYLKRLSALDLAVRLSARNWQRSSKLETAVAAASNRRERPGRRLNDIESVVAGLVDRIPPTESAGFRFDSWSTEKLPGENYSVRDALDFDEPIWRALLSKISGLLARLQFSPKPGIELFGLPFDRELWRAIERRRLENEAREREKCEALAAAAASRVNVLRERAAAEIGGVEADAWLNALLSKLKGRSPVQASEESSDGHWQAMDELDLHIRAAQRKVRAVQRKDAAVAALRSAAARVYPNPELASLWLRGRHPKLGGISPEEFCVDDVTRELCQGLLPAKRSSR